MRTGRRLVVAAVATLLLVAVHAGAVPRAAQVQPPDAPVDWTSPALRPALEAAAAAGMGYDAARGVAVPMAAAGGTFIRPGLPILVLGGGVSLCTSGFVFGAPGTYEISTAGHCGNVGSAVMVLAAPSLALPIGTVRVASCAPSENRMPCWGDDYALVRIDALWQPFVDASLADLGGPSSPDGLTSGVVRYVGLGLTRAGAAPAPFVPPSPSYFTCACPNAPGDSGAPAVDALTGAAVGILTAFSAAPFTLPYAVGTPLSILEAAAGQPLALGGLDPVPRPQHVVEAETGILPADACATDSELAEVRPGGTGSVVFLPALGCSLVLDLGAPLAPLRSLRVSFSGAPVVCGTLVVAGSTIGEASTPDRSFCLPSETWVEVPARGLATGGGIVTVTWTPVVEWHNVFIDHARTGDPVSP